MQVVRILGATSLVVFGLSACSPALDWREVRPGESAAVAWFPCKPASRSRNVLLAGVRLRLTLHACTAAQVTYALAHGDIRDPARVGDALAELQASAAANVAGTVQSQRAARVKGSTPNPAAMRVRLSGRRPDGTVLHEELAVFARGTRVYQAMLLGERLSSEATDTFFDGLSLVS